MDRALFEDSDVSRETLVALEEFSADLLKWTKKINLISPSTQGDIWERHIKDSAQLWLLRGESTKTWCDLGSGGGLPGLVLAFLSKGEGSPVRFTLIESDARKSAFLSTMGSKYDLPVQIITERIEAARPANADLVSARALAPMPKLLDFAHRHIAEGGLFLLQKGAQFKKEIDLARESWHFDCEVVPSRTHSAAVVLKIKEVVRA